MLEFTGEESNRFVLEQVLEELKLGTINGGDRFQIIQAIDDFLAHKEKMMDELGELTKKARGGDRGAARKVIQLMANMNDGE